MSDEDNDYLFSPVNSKRIAFALELLMGVNVVAIEVAVLVFLIAVADTAIQSASGAAAISRMVEGTNIFTKIFMLSGTFFFTVFFAVWLWLYIGRKRLQWAFGGLGYLLKVSLLIAWKYRANIRWIDDQESYPWIIFGCLLLVASGLMTYTVLTLGLDKRVLFASEAGTILQCIGMPLCFVLDSSGISSAVVQGLGMLVLTFAYFSYRAGLKEEKFHLGPETTSLLGENKSLHA
jgi:hypothetical protein